jgi:hypothetical protein
LHITVVSGFGKLAGCIAAPAHNLFLQFAFISQDLAKKDIKTLTLDKLEGVSTYQFLLTSEGQAQVKELMGKVVKQHMASGSSALTDAQVSLASSSTPSKREKPSKGFDDGVSAAADMFR